MRTLVPVPSRSAGDKWWEFGGVFFLFSFSFFFFLYFRIPSAGGFGLNRRWATRYVPSPDEECDVIAVLANNRPLNGNMSQRTKGYAATG